MKIEESLLKNGLCGKLQEVVRGLLSIQEQFQRAFCKHGYGPRILEMDISREPDYPDFRVDFDLVIVNNGVPRPCKLRFEMNDDRRHSVDQQRGKRDLSRLVIFLRIADRLGQIIHRIHKRVTLVAADIARQVASWKQLYSGQPMPDDFTRTWKRRRRHWCHRERFISTQYGAAA